MLFSVVNLLFADFKVMNEASYDADAVSSKGVTKAINKVAIETLPPTTPVFVGNYQINVSTDTFFLKPDSLILNFASLPSTAIRKIRRMPDSTCVAGDTLPSDSVRICCSDVDWSFRVVITVDSFTAMVTISVKDKLPPSILIPLDDITISCDSSINLANLSSQFGTYRSKLANRRNYSIGMQNFSDGYAKEFCDSIVVRSTYVDERRCGAGRIVRAFSIRDLSLNERRDTQIITVVNTGAMLMMADITFPNDSTILGCFKPPFAKNFAGEPKIALMNCGSMPIVSHTDMVFDDPTSGCPFIMRTWKVIDMCTFRPDKSVGYFEKVQNIYVVDRVSPTILTGCRDTTVLDSGGRCDVQVRLTFTGSDNCTKQSDLLYSYEIKQGATMVLFGPGASISAILPQGVYQLTWILDDRCGNKTICTSNLTLKEGKAPTPFLMTGLISNINKACDVLFVASQFNMGSNDNCTPSSLLRYSFSRNIDDDSIYYNCSKLGETVVQIWVTDEKGNQAFANTRITLQDLNNFCVLNKVLTIGGSVKSDEDYALSDVTIILDGAEQQRLMKVDNDGRYSMSNLEMLSNYELRGSKKDDFLNGVDVFDLVQIQKHILGIKPINNPYKLIAADIDNSKSINIRDIVELKKIILGSVKKDESEAWRLFNAKAPIDSRNPWSAQDYYYFKNVNGDLAEVNFKGVKIGDIDGTVNSTLATRSIKSRILSIGNTKLEKDKTYTVDITLNEDIDLVAFQTSLGYDIEALQLIEVSGDRIRIQKEDVYEVKKGLITIANVNMESSRMYQGEVVMRVTFKALKTDVLANVVNLKIDGAKSLMVSKSSEIYDMSLQWRNISEKILSVQQNAPNPFADRTNLVFSLTEDMPVEVTVYDQAGAKIHTDYSNYRRGTHTLVFGPEQLQNKIGIFFVHIESAEISEIRKMIRIK
jgi:hypothetical protein